MAALKTHLFVGGNRTLCQRGSPLRASIQKRRVTCINCLGAMIAAEDAAYELHCDKMNNAARRGDALRLQLLEVERRVMI